MQRFDVDCYATAIEFHGQVHVLKYLHNVNMYFVFQNTMIIMLEICFLLNTVRRNSNVKYCILFIFMSQ